MREKKVITAKWMIGCGIIIAAFLLVTGEVVMAMELKSSAFAPGGYIPRQYTGEGKDISPPLFWTDAPAGVESFVLICDDPDAPISTWVHWVIYNIPAQNNALPENIPVKESLSDGSKQGINDFRKSGYGGPMPPPGKAHRYFFKLYALNTRLDLPPGLRKSEVLKRIEDRIIGQAELMGLYKR